MKKFMEEFKAFALRGNVMDMAVYSQAVLHTHSRMYPDSHPHSLHPW